MKVKSYRTKLLMTILPIMAIVFCAISMIMNTRADGVFTPPEIVESISYMVETPTEGSPTDYTPLENFAFCNWQIYNAAYFESDAVGSAKADLGFTKYSQAVRNSRKIKNKTVFTETVSSSAFVSNAEQTYITPDNTVLFRPSAKVHGDSVVWSDKITPMNTDTYFSKYGSVPREITKYVVTEESVTSARLISFGGGEYIYEFILDPELAGKYFRYEIATRAGSSQPARISSVKMTLTMDDNWYVKTSVIEDEYSTDVPALGALSLVSEMTENFRYINEDRELEESKLFEPFLPKDGDDIIDDPITQNKQPSDYLANAFAPYLDGEPLNLDVNIEAFSSIHNIKLGVDIATLNIDALVDDALYFGYGDDKLYIGAGGLKGFVPTSSLAGLLDAIGSVIELPDMDIDLAGQLSEDFLGALFGGLELVEHDGYVSIDFGVKLSDVLVEGSPLLPIAEKISGNISISVYDGETITLRGIDATLDIAGVPVSVNIRPASRPSFPDRSEFADLGGALDFVKPIINTATAAAYKLDFDLDVNSAAFTDTVKIDATINRDLSLSADITLEKTGVTLNVLYDGNTVYLSAGNLRLKLETSDLGEIAEKAADILKSFGFDFELPKIELPELNFDIKELLAKVLALDLKELLSHIEEFSLVNENELRAAVNIGGNVYGANISHNGEYISSLCVDKISIKGVTLGISATLECFDSSRPVAASGEYVDINELVDFITPVLGLYDERNFAADISLSALGIDLNGDIRLIINDDDSLALDGNVELFGLRISFVYVDSRIYIESGNLKLTLKLSDINELVSRLGELADSLGLKLDPTEIDGIAELLSAIDDVKDSIASLKSMKIDYILSSVLTQLSLQNGTLRAGIALGGANLNVALTSSPVKADITVGLGGKDIVASLSLTDNKATSITPPEGEFAELGDLTLLLGAISGTVSHNSYVLDLTLDMGSVSASATLGFDRDFSVITAAVYIPAYDLTVDVVYANNTLYISTLGICVSASSSDIHALKEAILPLLPENAKGTAETVLNLLAPLLDGDIEGAIGSALPDGTIKNIITSVLRGDVGGIIGSISGNIADADLSGLLDKFTLSLDSSSLSVSAGGFDIALDHDGEILKTLSVKGSVGGNPITAALTLSSASEGKTDYVLPSNAISASELARFITPIKELTEKSGFVVNFEASLTMDGASLPISGEIVLLFKDSGLELQINANVSGVEIFFAMENGTYYIGYDETRVSATKADLDRLIAYVEPYLPAFTPRLIADITAKIESAMPSLGIKEILSALGGGGIDENGALWLSVSVGDVAMRISLSLTDDGKIDRLSLIGSATEENIGEIVISVGAGILEMYDDVTEVSLPVLDAGFTFVTADELIDYVDALINSLKLEAYHVSFDNIDVYYADKTERVTGYIEFQPTSGIPNLRMGINVYSKTLTDGEERRITDEELASTLKHTFDIMITDGDPLQEIYLTYNGVRFKLTIEEVRYLLGNLKDMLDITDREDGKEYDDDRISLLDKIIPEDREKVSSDFLDDFNVTMITNLADTVSGLLTIATDVINEGRDFMEDPDYDYTEIVELVKKTVGAVASLLGLDDIKLPTLGGIISSLNSLPRISLEEGVTEYAPSDTEDAAQIPTERTMTVIIDGVKFTLSRDTQRNFLSNWTFTGLKTSSTSTDFSLTLSEADPAEIARHVARPAYHDYDFGASLNNTYKHAEMRKDAENGLIEGYEPFGGENFTESDIDVSKRYKYSWFKYSQSNSGDYVKVGSDYVKIADFVSGAKNGSYMKISGEYVAFSSAYETWFAAKYGMSSNEYINTLGTPLNDLSNISNFTTALINTANRKDFHISGKAHISVAGIITVDIPIDIWVKLIPTKQADGTVVNKPLIIINISTPYKWTLLDSSATQIYFWDGVLYFAKTDTSGKYYSKVTWGDFVSQLSDTENLKKYLFFVLPFKGVAKSGLESAFKDDGSGESTPLEFSEIFNYYYYQNGSHIISIDLGTLAGTTMLSDAKIVLGTTKFAPSENEQAHTYITSLAFDTSILGSIMPASLNASLDIVNKVTNYRTVSRLTNDVLEYDSTHLIMDETTSGAIYPEELALLRDYLAGFEGSIV